MPLPYRTTLRLPIVTDVVALAEQEVEKWLESGGKVDSPKRVGFIDGSLLEPGLHQLSKGRWLAIARLLDHQTQEPRLLLRLTEENPSGTWQVSVAALASGDTSSRADTLVIEAARIDQPDAEGQVDPPRLVGQLLARETIFDGRTPVTPDPSLIDSERVSSVFDAITDERRSVTVIVACSPSDDLEDAFRDRVRKLTSKLSGVAAVFVLSYAAAGELNSRLPLSHQVENGRVRTFLPQVDLTSSLDGRRHRVLGPQTFARAIKGRNVARYLQSAFAVQTRTALMATPLPRQLRRQLSALNDSLSDVVRTSLVERLVSDERMAAPSPSKSVNPLESLVSRVGQAISRWLGRPVGSVTSELIDEADEFMNRQRASLASAVKALDESRTDVERILESNAELSEDLEFRGLELAEAEKTTAKLEDEVRYLRRELSKVGLHTQFQDAGDTTWSTPEDISDLLLRLDPRLGDPIADRVVFTGSADRAREVDARDQSGLYVQRCWEIVRSLVEYVDCRRAGSFVGNVHSYLQSDEHDSFKVSQTRHAPTESKQTLDQWGRERLFPVPKDVSPDGVRLMDAHFKIAQDSSFAPRLHYFDDSAGSGKIYVGYIGRHLTNTKTKNR